MPGTRRRRLLAVLAGVVLLALGALGLLLEDRGKSDPRKPDPANAPTKPKEPYAVLALDRPDDVGGAITGTVVDKDGSPICGASVIVSVRGDDRVARTDDAGVFLIEDLPGGSHALEVRAEALSPVTVGAPIRPGHTTRLTRPIVLAKPAPERVPWVPPEERPATVIVRVADESGDPIAGALVHADSNRDAKGRTGDDGLCRLEVQGDRLEVWVRAEGYLPRGRRKLEPDEDRPVEVEFRLERGTTVSGRVVDGRGRPLEGILVRAWQDVEAEGFVGSHETRTDADGRFEIGGLFSGRWVSLDARIGEEDEARVRRRKLRPDERDVILRIGPYGAIEGRILDAVTGQPMRADVWAVGPGPDDLAFADETGDRTFRLERLRPGPWTILARNESGRRLAHRAIVVRPDETAGPVELEIPDVSGLEISGRVLPGLDLQGKAVPAGNRQLRIVGPVAVDARTDPSGRFTAGGLVPGVYRTENEEGPTTVFRVPRKAEVEIPLTGAGSARLRIASRDAPDRHSAAGQGYVRDPWHSDLEPDESGWSIVRPGRHAFVLVDFLRSDPWSVPPVVVDLRPGDERTVELTRSDVPMVGLRVRLRRLLDRNFSVDRIVLVPRRWRQSPFRGLIWNPFVSAVSAADGWCETVDLPAGAYDLRLIDDDSGATVTVGPIHARGPGVVTREVELPAGSLAGVVRDGEEAVAWAEIRLHRPEDARRAVRTAWASVTADANGEWRVPYLPPGRYVVEVAAVDRAPAFVGEVTVDEGESRLGVVAPRGEAVRIEVTRPHGRPIFDYGYRIRLLDAEGRVLLEQSDDAVTRLRLRPGRYTAIAGTPGYAPTEVSFRVTGRGARVRIELRPAAAARVTVVDEAGPVANARIHVLRPDGRPVPSFCHVTGFDEPWYGAFRTSGEGRVLVDELPPGRLRLIAVTADGRRGETEVDVPEASLLDATIRLRAR